MNVKHRARALRAKGIVFAEISKQLGISLQYAYKCAGDIDRTLHPTTRTVVRRHAYNGGCSTQSGMMSISMPRIAALHGVAS